MTSTITHDQQTKIAEFLATVKLGKGLGKKERPCSISAINLELSGKLTDRIPDCMSDVIGEWIMLIQDQMPDKIRNSKEWREIIPFAAGTGKEMESERVEIILDWMWGVVLPQLQKKADNNGFGDKWSAMCREKTPESADAAADAAAAATAAITADAATDATGLVSDKFWEAIDPPGMLKKLIMLEDQKQ